MAGGFDHAQAPSGLLCRYRRYFAIAAFLLLATPLVVGIVRPDSAASILKEGRRLTPIPRAPANWREWVAFPKEVDAYLQDHFGLRQAMIRTFEDTTRPLSFGNAIVLIGQGGRLFYLGDDAVLQSAGLIYRRPQVVGTAALLARMNNWLTGRGIHFLVAVPPNAATTYRDFLPAWARNNGQRTEYDLLLDELKTKRIDAVDLRPVLEAARNGGPVFYLHDTHWTYRGALAGYNAIVEADGHPDWRFDPKSALGPPTIRPGGDLARMLDFDDRATETTEFLTLHATKPERLRTSTNIYHDYTASDGRPGPTILIIGDSFTEGYFRPMLMPHVGRIVWLHHRWCGFDWETVDQFHPDEVWWMPTERYLLCNPGVTPANFPR